MSALTSLIRYFFTHCIIRNSVVLMLAISLQNYVIAGEVSRKILVLYNSKNKESQTDKIVFENFQTILNYYGIMPEYRDFSIGPLPDDKFMSAYRGVFTALSSQEMKGVTEYLTWLNKQFEAVR